MRLLQIIVRHFRTQDDERDEIRYSLLSIAKPSEACSMSCHRRRLSDSSIHLDSQSKNPQIDAVHRITKSPVNRISRTSELES